MKKHRYGFLSSFFAFLFLFSMQIVFAEDYSEVNKALREVKGEVDTITAWIAAFGVLTAILIFIIHMIRLAHYGDNPYERQEVVKDIWITVITTALLGSIGVVIRLFISTSWGV